MLIAPRAKILFVHVGKTGGTSVTSCLSKALPDAVALLDGKIRGVWVDGRYHANLFMHSKAADFRSSLVDFDRYVSFCFARNPWDRAVSWYEYLRQHEGGLTQMKQAAQNGSFSEFVRNRLVQKQFANQSLHSFAFDGKRQIVTFVGKFENLQSDFSRILRLAGLPDIQLPVLNESRRRSYAEYYTNSSDIALIADIWRTDIELMGYKF